MRVRPLGRRLYVPVARMPKWMLPGSSELGSEPISFCVGLYPTEKDQELQEVIELRIELALEVFA